MMWRPSATIRKAFSRGHADDLIYFTMMMMILRTIMIYYTSYFVFVVLVMMLHREAHINLAGHSGLRG